ncbi:Sulfate-binding protein precursor [Rickettsiales bacterium Ac37b]|nr:Sulfate-binding protein precursor [Rickettsiales bacterium Ac37b]
MILNYKILITLLILLLPNIAFTEDKISLLNVSYDPTRELYQEINNAFSKKWELEHLQKVEIKQSHGGSSKQARSVIEGLSADVVSLATAYDIEMIALKGLIHDNWYNELPNNSSPYRSTIVFLVRKNSTKHIADWDDLIKEGITVVTSNPKTSGGARWNYLAGWAYAINKFHDNEEEAIKFIKKLYKNVPILDVSARASTMSFVHRNIGDVLIAWENEALLITNHLAQNKFEIVIPSITMQIDLPVAVVSKVTEKHKTTKVSKAYLEFLYTDIAQEIIAKNYYRPINKAILEQYMHYFSKINSVTIDTLGGWKAVYNKHFANNAIFDQVYK